MVQRSNKCGCFLCDGHIGPLSSSDSFLLIFSMMYCFPNRSSASIALCNPSRVNTVSEYPILYVTLSGEIIKPCYPAPAPLGLFGRSDGLRQKSNPYRRLTFNLRPLDRLFNLLTKIPIHTNHDRAVAFGTLYPITHLVRSFFPTAYFIHAAI